MRDIGDTASLSPAQEVSVQSSDSVAGWRRRSTPTPVAQAPGTQAAGTWTGSYFNNTSLSGSPAVTRSDGAAIDFDWWGSPASGVPSDYFSVRWTRTFDFGGGTYQFALTHDDGGRLFVDGQLVMQQWYMQVPTTFAAQRSLAQGTHTVTVEYYTTWGEAVADLAISQVGVVPAASKSTSTQTAPTATNTAQPTATTAAPTATRTPTTAPSAATSTPTPASAATPFVPTPTATSVASTPTSTAVPPTATNTPPPTPTRTSTPVPPTATRTSTPIPPTATATVAAVAVAGTRDKYAWPCASTSIWNMPIGSGAVYVPGNIQAANGWGGAITTDDEIIDLNPNDPLKPLNGGAQVHVSPSMSHDGSWNGVAAFLGADGNSVAQGQPLVLSPGGNPFWNYNYPTVDIRGDCIAGAHGGSGLSSFGGSIRKGELSSSQPLHHALKVNLYASRFLSQSSGGYRWPASHADSYALSGGGCPAYGGSVAALRMGSLLALPPGTDLSFINSVRARKIAQAMMDYGAYVVDDTCWDVHAIDIEQGAEFSDGGTFDSDLQRVFRLLAVVDNNGPSSIGGGGTPRVPLAPPIGN